MSNWLCRLTEERMPLVVPGVYDGISAVAARAAGFSAMYVGSYGTSAAKYGLPDLGYIGLEDMADMTRRISDASDARLIVDGEGGWGNALQAARAVRVLEKAGAAAVHIEDQEFGKHLTATPAVLALPRAQDKLKAALDARSSEDTVIIGRTDLGGDAAVDRAVAFQDVGVDAIFIAGDLNAAQWRRVRDEISVTVVTVDEPPGVSAAQRAQLGAHVVLYWGLSVFAAQRALVETLGELASSWGGPEVGADLPAWQQVDDFLGIQRDRAAADRYGLLDQPDATTHFVPNPPEKTVNADI